MFSLSGVDFLMTLATVALLRPVLEAIFLVDRPEELRTRILSFSAGEMDFIRMMKNFRPSPALI
jgi:hypothetical protein